MQVVLSVRNGPMTGRLREVDLGPDPSNRLVIGRDPGPGGWLLEGDSTVSRRHGKLFVRNGEVIYENDSPNGTSVGDSMVLDQIVVSPGSMLKIGRHEIEVGYRPVAATSTGAEEGGSLWTSGPLANPALRAALGLYLLMIVGVVIFFSLRGDQDASRAFTEARTAYEATYLPATTSEAEAADRLQRASHLAIELEAHVRAERWLLAEATCRQLMALDGDSDSPMFAFAADQLGDLSQRRR